MFTFLENKSKIEKTERDYAIDISGALATGFEALEHEFLVSFTKDEVPCGCIGGEISLYEEKGDFNTYKISYGATRVEILTK